MMSYLSDVASKTMTDKDKYFCNGMASYIKKAKLKCNGDTNIYHLVDFFLFCRYSLPFSAALHCQ